MKKFTKYIIKIRVNHDIIIQFKLTINVLICMGPIKLSILNSDLLGILFPSLVFHSRFKINKLINK